MLMKWKLYVSTIPIEKYAFLPESTIILKSADVLKIQYWKVHKLKFE